MCNKAGGLTQNNFDDIEIMGKACIQNSDTKDMDGTQRWWTSAGLSGHSIILGHDSQITCVFPIQRCWEKLCYYKFSPLNDNDNSEVVWNFMDAPPLE